MFFKSKSNIINTQVLKVKTDKIAKRITRDAKKRIKRGELIDARSLSLYLGYIDAQYDHIKADVRNSTMVVNYDAVRAARVAETAQLIAFYDNDFNSLKLLYKTLVEKAEESGRSTDLRHDITAPPDMSELKAAFRELNETPSEAKTASHGQKVKVAS